MKKVCCVCKIPQPVGQFRFKDKEKRYLSSTCIPCKDLYAKSHYQKNKAVYKARSAKRNTSTRNMHYAMLFKYLEEHPCVICGETDITVLEFDHTVSKGKVTEVTTMVRWAYSWATILKEIEKCKVMCANCHRRKTAKQFNWKRYRKLPV